MFKLKEKFLNLPIEGKINLILAAFLIVMILLIGAFWFGMDIMSATRAFVGGEGLWSKAQKNATVEILQYADTFDQRHYDSFHEFITVPLISKIARLELEKENYNPEIVEKSLVAGGTNIEDVPSMTRLYRWFGDIGLMKEAINIWNKGDMLIREFQMKGSQIHTIAQSVDSPSDLNQQQTAELNSLINDINNLNTELTKLEDEFSQILGEGSRILKQRLIIGMIIFALILSGLFLLFVIYIRNIVAKVDEAKSEFVYLASHQLKTPLTSINWYTERLKKKAKNLSDQGKKYLSKINRNSNRMARLVYDLLNVSRVEMGGFAVNPKESDVIKIANEVLEDFKNEIENKKLNIEKDFESDSLNIKIDRNLFELVIYNLLSNAVQYTEEDDKIKLSIKKAKEGTKVDSRIIDSECILLSVSDTGLGIPKDEENDVFQKFFRSKNAEKKNTTGSGLGLYLVKSIIDQIKGEIWFESKLNEGTTFYVTFPTEGMEKQEGRKELTSYNK